jgi:translation initiation factor 3 subunit H
LQIHNSHLLTSFLHQLPVPAAKSALKEPTSVSSIESNPFISSTPLSPNYDTLSVNIDPFLSQTCDLLLESVEVHYTESNNFAYYSRALGREQTKISQWQAKRKAENALRTSTKQPLLPEDEWQRLFKLPTEPNRLESMLNSRQVEQYSRQVDGFVAATTGKMFAVRGNLLPGEGGGGD